MRKRHWKIAFVALVLAMLLPSVAQAKTVTIAPKKKEKYRYKMDKHLVHFQKLKLSSSVDRLRLNKDVWYLYYWEDLVETDPGMAQCYDSLLRKAKSVKTITVSPKNKKLKAVNGLLMDKAGQYLECCPPAKRGKVIVPEGVKVIGKEAFAGCENVTELQLPASLKGMNEAAFWGMKSLKKITISSKNKWLKVVDNVLYSKDGKKLLLYPASDSRTEFVVPSQVDDCAEASFSASVNLKTVVLPEGLLELKNSIFQNSNIETLAMPQSLRYIDAEAFSGCKKLRELKLNEGLLKIRDDAFCHTTNLRDIYLPDSVLECEDMFGFEKNRVLKTKTVHLYGHSRADVEIKDAYPSLKVQYVGTKEVTNSPKIDVETAVKGSGNPDTSWYKKGKKSYEITTPDQLAGMAVLTKRGISFKKVNFLLKNDLDLSCYENWNPIGPGKLAEEGRDSGKLQFRGTFDGNEHTIYNLTCKRYDDDLQGLFGTVKGTIKNLSVKHATVAGIQEVGILVGYMEGKIQNCVASGNVFGVKWTGGICGSLMEDGSSIIRCKNYANVIGYEAVGGLVGTCGWLGDCNMKACENYGDIKGSYKVAGIAGEASDRKRLKNCKNKGRITGYEKTSAISNKQY